MPPLQQIVLVIHLLLAVGLIGLVLLQRSEGGALGIGGGGGGLISGRGAADALARSTMIIGALFFVTSLSLSLLAGGSREPVSVVDTPAPPARAEPAPVEQPVRAAPLPTTQPVDPASGAVVAPSPQVASDRAAPTATTGGGDVAPAPTGATRSAAPEPRAPEAPPAPALPESAQTAPGLRERAGPDE